MFCTNNNLVIAHEEIECKTNEIPIAQKLIPNLPFNNSVLTFDALNCQVNTIDVVLNSNNDIVVQVKNNQKKLLHNCIDITNHNSSISEYAEPFNKAHGRIESRKVNVFLPTNVIDKKWSEVNSIIEVNRIKQVFDTKAKKWEDKNEFSYYISSTIFSAKESNTIIRNHWGIENKNHYVKDVTMKEDSSRIRINPQNIARLRSFALNVLRFNNVNNVNDAMYENVLDFKALTALNGL